MKELDLGQPEIAWHTVRDRIAEVGCFLGLVTGTCGKIAFDVKLMMQTEVEEVYEPFHEGRGSSSHHAAEAQPDLVRLHHRAHLAWCASTSRRCSTPWSRTTSAPPGRGRSSGSCCRRFSALAPARWRRRGSWSPGLQVDEKKMRANLDITNGLIVSEAVMMGLGPHLGRQYAHDLVYDICRKVVATGRPLARPARRKRGDHQAPRPRRAGEAVRSGELSRRGRRDGRSRAGHARALNGETCATRKVRASSLCSPSLCWGACALD